MVSSRCSLSIATVAVGWLLQYNTATAFVPMTTPTQQKTSRLHQDSSSSFEDFSKFAAALEEEKEAESTATTSVNGNNNNNNNRYTTISGNTYTVPRPNTWQDNLDELLKFDTSAERRQVLLQQLVNANQDIRKSVETALQERNLEPLLTPTGKRVQDGTRAVARQLTNDILPKVVSSVTSNNSNNNSPFPLLNFPRLLPRPLPASDVTKVGSRILNALQNQIQQNLETLQSDLRNPGRIPQRLSQQTNDLVKEAGNVFAEVPAGLKEPPYTVVTRTDDYEIRDYLAHTCAVTAMRVPANENVVRNTNMNMNNNNVNDDGVSFYYDPDNMAEAGAAFNTLAAYLFGANKESRAMSMTMPVTTTLTGEMRFYLAEDGENRGFPDPLAQDESQSYYATNSISVQEIPPARLAVRRFTGFCTTGEITRQKQALLAALELDGVAIDVPHGQTVRHVLFQYNPPYTLPVLRRNEIAVPVLSEARTPQDEWQADSEYDAQDVPSA